jgi:hypothetical protein
VTQQPLGVGSHAAEVNPSGAQFDEEQHIQPLEPDRVDGEEVTGHDPGGLRAQESLPGHGSPSRCRIEPVTLQCRADRGGRDANTKAQQLALDALVAPVGVLPGQPDDELLDVLVKRWPAGLAVRVGPGAGDQAAVPTQ